MKSPFALLLVFTRSLERAGPLHTADAIAEHAGGCVAVAAGERDGAAAPDAHLRKVLLGFLL